MRKNRFGPFRMTEEVFNSVMHPIDPIIRDDGRELKRYRLMDAEKGPIYTEDPMDRVPFEVGEIDFAPMKQPTSRIFFEEFTFGDDDDETGNIEK